MALLTKLRRLAAAIRKTMAEDRRPPYSGISSPPGSINDGVEYELPAQLWAMAEQLSRLEPKAQMEALREADSSFGFTFDNPYRGPNDEPFVFTESALVEWPWSLRKAIAVQCHTAYHRNPIAKRAVNYIAAFVVGEGFQLTCRNKDVEKVLQDFIAHPDNTIRQRERQAVIDLIVDGELFWRFYDGEGEAKGQTTYIPMRPWECQWVNTEPGFYKRVVDYRFTWRVTQGDAPMGQKTAVEDIPAREILHVPIGNHSYEVRGRSELYNVLPWLKAYKEWLENRARQNHWRGALLWWVKLIGARPETVASKVAQYSQPPTPGSIAVTTDKEEWQALTNPVGGSDASEDGRHIKLMSAVGMGIPEYFLADGSNANLASSKSQQLPALMTMGEYQLVMTRQVWTPVFKRVLQNAIDAGLLPEQVPEQDDEGDPVNEPVKGKDGKPVMTKPKQTAATPEGTPETGPDGMPLPPPPVPRPVPKEKPKVIDTLDAFEVRYEPLGEGKDLFTLAQGLQIAAQNSWVSNESASREMGFDYSQERKRMRREAEAEANDEDAGLKSRPPVMRPEGMTGEPGKQIPPEMTDMMDKMKQAGKAAANGRV